jgi:hypothetical protein
MDKWKPTSKSIIGPHDIYINQLESVLTAARAVIDNAKEGKGQLGDGYLIDAMTFHDLRMKVEDATK